MFCVHFSRCCILPDEVEQIFSMLSINKIRLISVGHFPKEIMLFLSEGFWAQKNIRKGIMSFQLFLSTYINPSLFLQLMADIIVLWWTIISWTIIYIVLWWTIIFGYYSPKWWPIYSPVKWCNPLHYLVKSLEKLHFTKDRLIL